MPFLRFSREFSKFSGDLGERKFNLLVQRSCYNFPVTRIICKAILLIVAAMPATAQVSGNVMTRVFQIRVPGGTATTFVLEKGEKQYLFTAAHVVDALGERSRVELMVDGKWLPLDVRILHGDRKCNDVAVLVPDQTEPLVKADPLPQTNNFYIGQEVYFLGFPYGLAMQVEKLHFTAALVKHGYVSAAVRCSDLTPGTPADKSVMLLDGFNNPGFSGGPVVTRDLDDPARPFKIIGIISGFRFESMPISVNGQNAIGASVQTNTGIIVAIEINEAFALIDADEVQHRVSKP